MAGGLVMIRMSATPVNDQDTAVEVTDCVGMTERR